LRICMIVAAVTGAPPSESGENVICDSPASVRSWLIQVRSSVKCTALIVVPPPVSVGSVKVAGHVAIAVSTAGVNVTLAALVRLVA